MQRHAGALARLLVSSVKSNPEACLCKGLSSGSQRTGPKPSGLRPHWWGEPVKVRSSASFVFGPGKGPCETTHLESYTVIGLAFGAFGVFGEVSKSVDTLVKEIAAAKAQRWRELGAMGNADARATATE